MTSGVRAARHQRAGRKAAVTTDRGGLLDVLARLGPRVAVVHLDVRAVRDLNRDLGHERADHLLEALAGRLARVIGGAGALWCDGGRFTAALRCERAEEADEWCRRLAASADEPFAVPGTCRVALDVGLAAGLVTDRNAAARLVDEAVEACRRAKSARFGGLTSISPEGPAIDGIDEPSLAAAITQGQLRLHYQPKVDLRTGRIAAVEALVRWLHPAAGLLAPGQFLPLAERTGLIVPLGDWALDEAARQAAEWARSGVGLGRVYVNVAAAQFSSAGDLVAAIVRALRRHRVDPDALGIEVTESSLLADLDIAVRALERVRALGVDVALDDFGTGWSSLGYLRNLPVTGVKIDRSFVSGIDDSLADATIVEAVTELAHALGLQVVAEGVEGPAQASALALLGVDLAQGYHFCRPLPPDELQQLAATAWCGRPAPVGRPGEPAGGRVDLLPGRGTARSRLLVTALDHVPGPVMLTQGRVRERLGHKVVYANPAFCRSFGFDPGEVVGRWTADLISQSSGADELAALTEATDAGRAVTVELELRHRDGSCVPYQVAISPVHDDRDVRTHWLVVLRDLRPERARAAAERAALERVAAFLEQLPDIVVVLSRDGRVRYANRTAQAYLHVPPDQIVGTDGLAWVHPDDRAAVTALAAAWSGDAVGQIPLVRLVAADGTVVPVEATSTEDLADGGDGQLVVVLRPIAERIERERREAERARLLKVRTRIAELALDAEPGELLAGLDSVCRTLGRALGVDLCFIDRLDGTDAVVVGRWSSAGDAPRRTIPRWREQLPQWAEAVESQAALIVRDATTGRQPWDEEKAAYFGQTAVASAQVTLTVGGRLTGVLGIASFDTPRDWTDEELELLTDVGRTVCHVFERASAEQALRRSERRLTALLEQSSDIVMVCGEDGTLHYVSPVAERWLGRPAEALVGTTISDHLHPDDVTAAGAFAGPQPRPACVRLRTAQGTYRWFDVGSSERADPLLGGIVLTLREASSRIDAMHQLERRRELATFAYRCAQRALDVQPAEFLASLATVLAEVVGLLGADLAYVDEVVDGTLCNLGGWTRPELAMDATVISPDRLEHHPGWAAALRRGEVIVVRDALTAEDAWFRDAKHLSMIRERAVVAMPLTAAGELLGVLGVSTLDRPVDWAPEEVDLIRRLGETVANTIERARAEHALRASEERYRLLSDHMGDVVAVTSPDGRLLYLSPSVTQVLGFERTAGGDAPVDWHLVIHRDDLDAVFAAAAATLEHGHGSYEARFQRADGTFTWLSVTTTAIAEGPWAGAMCSVARPIDDRKALEAELHHRAHHDVLTGLGNRCLLQERLDATGGPVALFLIDLDGFKRVNDEFGHAEGDALLVRVAGALTGVAPPGATVTRSGGDEFVVLVPGIDARRATQLGEEMAQAIATSSAHPVCASIGVAVTRGGADPDELLGAADTAMYAAKRSGGGVRVTVRR